MSDTVKSKEKGESKNPRKRRLTVLDRPSIRRGGWFSQQASRPVAPRKHEKLGQWLATGICGNDITSSCLYVAAIATTYAGVLSPVVLLFVAGTLYLFRGIYAEVGDALPLNGGAYNCLLNTTTKAKASVAACFTLLSYMATAVISAKTAVDYLHSGFPFFPTLEVAILLLAVFMGLAILGITESAKVALAIFIFHMISLAVLIALGLLALFSNPTTLELNWAVPSTHSLSYALFFGFSAGLLGISGFESSANYIEEQADGVFPKTLRNMWVAVTILNPTIALVVLSVLPIGDVIENKKVLADAAFFLGGDWLKHVIVIDAFLVLSGAVLTSFVGSGGLMGRMALDRCLPQFLLSVNKRGSRHWIAIFFFLICASILLLTKGEIKALAVVYTISFLSVMTLFAIGNGLLKIRRNRLPRKYRASWISVFLALVATTIGIIGNVMIEMAYTKYFLLYAVPTFIFVMIMLFRHHFLRGFLVIANDMVMSIRRFNMALNDRVQGWLEEINSHGIIFFTKGDDAAHLNEAMLYVRNNEITQHVTVVHVYEDEKDIPANLEPDLEYLDELYPEIQIELVKRKGKFGPDLIDDLSQEFGIPKNYMFIGAPSDRFPHRIADLGGVRLII